MGELCNAYPLGIGLVCVGYPEPSIRMPPSVLFQVRPQVADQLAHVCLLICHCADIAPDLPSIHEVTSERLASMQIGEVEESIPVATRVEDTTSVTIEVGESTSVATGVEESTSVAAYPSSTASVDAHRPTGSPRPARSHHRLSRSHSPTQSHRPTDSPGPVGPDPGGEGQYPDIHCSGRLYGYPEREDCRSALSLHPDDFLDDSHIYREYLRPGALPSDQANGGSVETPFHVAFGTCHILFLLQEGHTNTMERIICNAEKVIISADDTIDHCVGGLRGGGYFHRQPTSPRPAPLPDVYVYSDTSFQREWFDLKYACLADAEGNAQCHNTDPLLDKEVMRSKYQHRPQDGPIPVAEEASSSSQPKAVSEDAKKRCSGSCYNPSDCDISSDCLCASNKGIPLDMSWGQHTCMYVAGALRSLTVASRARGSPCRGRCLLEADGSLEIDASLLGSSSDKNGTLVGAPPSSPTAPVPGQQPSNSRPVGGSVASANNQSRTSDLPDRLLRNQSSPSNRTFPLPPTLSPQIATFDEQPAPILNCPCNCTYVSAACCLSPLVWEDASKQILMKPPGDNATVCCDFGSGTWMSKATGCAAPPSYSTAANLSLSGGSTGRGGFVNMGSVPWSGSKVPHEVEQYHELDG